MLDPAKQLCRPIYIGSHSSSTQRTPHVPLLENAGSSKGALPSYFFPHWVVEVGIREDHSGPEGNISTQRNPLVPLLENAGSSKGALPSDLHRQSFVDYPTHPTRTAFGECWIQQRSSAVLFLSTLGCRSRDPRRPFRIRGKDEAQKEAVQTSDWVDQPGDYLNLLPFYARTPLARARLGLASLLERSGPKTRSAPAAGSWQLPALVFEPHNPDTDIPTRNYLYY